MVHPVVLSGRTRGDAAPFEFKKKKMSFSIRYHKKLIKFRGYSLIHNNKIINPNLIRLTYSYYTFY